MLINAEMKGCVCLNCVSSQCARGKSSLAWKLEVHPKFFNGKKKKKNFLKCNRPDFKFYLYKLNNKKYFLIWCNVNFESVFTALKQYKKAKKI